MAPPDDGSHDPDTLRSSVPWPAPLSPPAVTEQDCARCGEPMTLRTLATPEGTPDFVQVWWPESGWLGWILIHEDNGTETVSLLALCSDSCLAEWFGEKERKG